MASVAEQIAQARLSSELASSLEDENRIRIEQAFAAWDEGKITNRQIRHRLETIVRSSYRASGGIAREHTRRASELDGWTPPDLTFQTDYLSDLIRDVRRNLREYGVVRRRKSTTSDDLDRARRRALSRISHGAGVATTRGYTDGLLQSYRELEAFGYRLVKMWMANFSNGHVPCDHCRALHGMKVGLKESFPTPVTTRTLKVYRDLQGPPRHPHCHCVLVIVIVTLENVMETIAPDVDPPDEDDEDESMTSSAVRRLGSALFRAVIAALKAMVKFGVKAGFGKPL